MNCINEDTISLAGLISRAVVNDYHWKAFGYKSRPKRGNFFRKFIDESLLAKEDFIIKELLLLATIDVIESIRKSKVSYEDKLLYTTGMMAHLFIPLLQSKIFLKHSDFFAFIKEGRDSYTNEDFIGVFLSRAEKIHDKKVVAGGLLIAALYDKKKGFILDRDIIAEKIFPINQGDKLDFPLNRSFLSDYANFADRILGEYHHNDHSI